MSSASTHTYLDTSALMRRAESLASPATARNALIGPLLEGMIRDPARKIGCSEVTLLEFHTNVTTNFLRSSDPQFDQTWWDEAIGQIMDDLGSGRIEVLEVPPKATEHVMSLVTVATGAMNRKLRAWDAMHAVAAAKWAEESGETVTILTTDTDFDVALNVMAGFGRLRIENLDILAHTGEGADRA